MTPAEFSSYLAFAALILGVLGVVNLLRPQKRWLGAGAVMLGVGAMLYRQGLSTVIVGVVCGLAVVCMVKDIGARGPRKAS